MDSRSVTFVGGGPRAAMVLERITANYPHDAAPLTVHVVEPFEPGAGRIWRYDQSPLLKLNSMAQDITMFTDRSVQCAGPAREGPTLLEWCRAVLSGEITDHRITDPEIMAQVRELGPESFPTRQLQSFYLGWFYRLTVEHAASNVRVETHRATVTAVTDTELGHTVNLDSGETIASDAVVYTVGHTDSMGSNTQLTRERTAGARGGFYAPPAYTNDVDYSPVRAGDRVIVTGMGLAFIDLMVLLYEGRGGRFQISGQRVDGQPREGIRDGGPLTYVACGREPQLFVGSRRGVPYHSKITSVLSADPEPLRFITPESVSRLLQQHNTLNFHEHLWPLINQELGYHVYRELIVGHPERAWMSWEEFAPAYRAASWGSNELQRLVRTAIPDSRYRVDLASIDRPFEDMFFEDPQQVQDALVRYIERDLTLRTHPDHSETQALFLALLRTYMEVGRLVPLEHLDDESQRLVPGWWHGFFSFVDSGPPAHRLQELLALHRAGFITFLGPDLEVTTAHQDAPEGTAAFRARSRAGGADVSANSWIEARLPAPTVVSSADPALHHVHSSGAGVEQTFETEDGATVSTGKLVVESTAQVVDRAGGVQPTVFAAGNFTSAWNVGAFARPHANSAPFRQCDELARTVLSALGLPVVPAS